MKISFLQMVTASILGISVTGDTPGNPIPWGGNGDGDEVEPGSNVAHWDELMDKY